MEVVIRVALMLFFIQFVVMIGVMVVAILVAQPEVPLVGREPAPGALWRGSAYAIRLPGRAARSAARVLRAAHGWRENH